MKSPRTTREELERLVGAIRRCLAYWKRALLVFVLTAMAAAPYSVTRPRSYKSETVVLYQETMRSADLTGSEGSAETGRRLGARLREALLSRTTLEPIITNLRLYPGTMERRGLVDAVDEMRKHVTFRAREGDTYEISFEGGSPEEVQEVTKSLGECIVREAASRRAEHARVLKEFVDVESERNKLELKEKEGALASFLVRHPEFKRPVGSELPVVVAGRAQAVSPEDQTLFGLEARAARIDQQLRGKKSAPRPLAVPAAPPADSPELVAARKELADKLARFTEKHPDVVAARARVRAAEANQAAALLAAARALPPESAPELPAGTTEEEKETLRQELAGLNAKIAARRAANARGTPAAQPVSADSAPPEAVALEVEFRRLQREVNDARERQRLLDEKQFKASISASSAADDRNIQVSILDPAYRPTHPSSRPRSTMLSVALAICFVLALLTAVVSAQLDDRIRARADLEHLDLLPVLGVIPRAAPLALTERAGDASFGRGR